MQISAAWVNDGFGPVVKPIVFQGVSNVVTIDADVTAWSAEVFLYKTRLKFDRINIQPSMASSIGILMIPLNEHYMLASKLKKTTKIENYSIPCNLHSSW